MKIFGLFFWLLCSGLITFGQTVSSQEASYMEIHLGNEKSKVKSRKVYIYQYSEEKLVKSDLQQISYFNEKGKESSRVFLFGNGAMSRKITFDYDPKGRLKHKTHYNRHNNITNIYTYQHIDSLYLQLEQMFLLPDNQLQNTILRKYNSQWQLLEERTYKGDTLRQNHQQLRMLEYDSSGLMIQQDFYDDSGLIYQSFWYDYDDLGQETDFMSLDGVGNLLTQRHTYYSEDGKEQLAYLGEKMLPVKVEYTWKSLDEGLKEEQKSFYREGKLTQKEIMRYDSYSRLLLYQKSRMNDAYEDGIFSERIEHIYNSQGLLSESLYYINTELQKRHLYLYEYY